MPRFMTLITGAHFRPPAKQVLAVLPTGTRVRLQQENDNPYDAEAIKVWLDLDQIPASQFPALEAELPNAGLTLEQLMSTGPVWLGYIASSTGKPLAKARAAGEDLVGNHELWELAFTAEGEFIGPEAGVSCELGFALDGSPRLVIVTKE